MGKRWDRWQEAGQQDREEKSGQVSYVKVFLAVLFAGWILYAIITASQA